MLLDRGEKQLADRTALARFNSARAVEKVGLARVIEEVGLDRLLDSLTPEQLAKLKSRL